MVARPFIKRMKRNVREVSGTTQDGDESEESIDEMEARDDLLFRRWMHKRGIGLIGCEIRCPQTGTGVEKADRQPEGRCSLRVWRRRPWRVRQQVNQ